MANRFTCKISSLVVLWLLSLCTYVASSNQHIYIHTYGINEKKCNNFPFHYFPFPVHSYFTTEYAYAYSTQLSTVFQLCAFQAGIRMYIRITIPGVWNGKLLFHSTLNIPGQSGFGNGKFAFHSILPVWNSRGMLHFFSLIPYVSYVYAHMYRSALNI